MNVYLAVLLIFLCNSAGFAQSANLMVRIAEIEIDSVYLEDYKAILKEESVLRYNGNPVLFV